MPWRDGQQRAATWFECSPFGRWNFVELVQPFQAVRVSFSLSSQHWNIGYHSTGKMCGWAAGSRSAVMYCPKIRLWVQWPLSVLHFKPKSILVVRLWTTSRTQVFVSCWSGILNTIGVPLEWGIKNDNIAIHWLKMLGFYSLNWSHPVFRQLSYTGSLISLSLVKRDQHLHLVVWSLLEELFSAKWDKWHAGGPFGGGWSLTD